MEEQTMEENRITAIIKEKTDVVRTAFTMAVDNDLLRKNPFDFERAKVLINDAVKRDALTAKHRFAYL